MDSPDSGKLGKIEKFWAADRVGGEAHHIPPQRSGY